MKKISLFIFIFLVSIQTINPMVQPENDYSVVTILDQNQKPIKAIQELAKLTNIPFDGSLSDLITKTQKEQPDGWMRAAGKERWEVQNFFEPITAQATQIFDTQLHMKQTIMPTKNHYDYAAIHGGLLTRMRAKLKLLIDCWNSGVRFDTLVILCGERLLDPVQESEEALYNANNGLFFKKDWVKPSHSIKYESDMAKLIIDQTEFPQEWEKSVKIVFAIAPGHYNEKNVWIRPTTQDTITAWLKTNPKPGTVLAISSQPHAGYQHAITKKLLKNNFELETAGPAAKNDEPISIYFDALARWLYSEQN